MSPESGFSSGFAYPATNTVLLTVALLETSGTPVAFEVAPVIVLLPLNGIVCFHVASVPWLS